jgi:drug/metabolite transporter (DMT)-like permease
MTAGIIYALAACFVWGIVFIIPLILYEFSSIEISAGRFGFYGMVSLALLARDKFLGGGDYKKSTWLSASYFSFLWIFGFTLLVLSTRYSSAAMCALIFGIGPITIAFYGNWLRKEQSFRSLAIPSAFILLGLFLTNCPKLIEHETPQNYLLGILFGFLALACWSQYAVANAVYLKNNPDIAPASWATLMGITAFGWMTALYVVYWYFFGSPVIIETFKEHWIPFVIGCLFLGFATSWLGSYFWNRACLLLPVSLAGQLSVFETIFGIAFVCLMEGNFPLPIESFGIAMLLMGVLLGVQRLSPPEKA